MTTLRLPVGYDDFREVVESKFTFIDKSLFIKEFFDNDGTQVPIITRPRRFGKTLNLSMMRYFLASIVDGRPTKGLFDNLKIAAIPGDYMEHQGKYPVIFVTFKDIKKLSFQDAIKDFHNTVQDLYRGYLYLLNSENLTDIEKKVITNITNRNPEISDLELSLKRLSELLYKHHKQKVFILIDEYDTPIQSSYINGFYDEMIDFTRNLLGAALKSNTFLKRGLVTGVISVAKESLFSGLNNVKLFSVLQTNYSEHFGFTEIEVENLLQKANMMDKAQEIRDWYNGYQFGNTTIYNPWSIINCITENSICPYWVNTSDNAIIRKHILEAPLDFKGQLEKLLQGELIQKRIDEHVVFGDLKNNITALWSLLVTSGYLKVTNVHITEYGETICTLAIPNREIYSVYRNMINKWLSDGKDDFWYRDFLQSLLLGDIKSFSENLKQIMLQTLSFHDVAKEPEAFYHGLMLGFTACLDPKQYEIKSNRESGLGRFDIMITPKDINKIAIIFELKSLKAPKRSEPAYTEDELEVILPNEATAALKQIEQKSYTSELQQRGIHKNLLVGIAFYGKHFAYASK